MNNEEVVPGRDDLHPGRRGGGFLPRLAPPRQIPSAGGDITGAVSSLGQTGGGSETARRAFSDDIRTLTAREAYETAIADAQCWLARNGHRAASLALPEMPGGEATGLEYRGG